MGKCRQNELQQRGRKALAGVQSDAPSPGINSLDPKASLGEHAQGGANLGGELGRERDGQRGRDVTALESDGERNVIHGSGARTPNDLKLSERGGWRSPCAGAGGRGRRRWEAWAVTAVAVRCSAWLAVAFVAGKA